MVSILNHSFALVYIVGWVSKTLPITVNLRIFRLVGGVFNLDLMLYTFRTAGALGFCCPRFYTPSAPLVLRCDELKPRRGGKVYSSIRSTHIKPQRGERCIRLQTLPTKLTPMGFQLYLTYDTTIEHQRL